MANFLAGDVIDITCTHMGRTYRYSPKSGESFNIDKGGRRTKDENGDVTSNGQNIRSINNAKWSIDGPIAVDLLTGYEENSLIKMSASPSEGIWQVTHVSGAIFKGKGSPVGDIKSDSNTATLSLKISGAGGLETIS